MLNVDLGAPSHVYVLFKLISKIFNKIRMHHYQKEYNFQEVLINKSSIKKKLSKIYVFKNL